MKSKDKYGKKRCKKKKCRFTIINAIAIAFLLLVAIILTKITEKKKKFARSITINMHIKKQIINKNIIKDKKDFGKNI